MIRKRRWFWHVYPFQILLVLGLLLLATLDGTRRVRRLAFEQMTAALESDAHLLADLSIPLLRPADPAAIQALCRSFGRSKTVRMTLVAPDGRVLGDSDSDPSVMVNHSDRPEIREALSGREGLSRRFSLTLEKQFMYVAVPVRIEGAVAAAARASKSIADVQAAVHTARFHVGMAPWGAGLLIALLALLYSLQLKKSVALVRDAENRIRSGELGRRLYHVPLPDLDPAADGFNAMADSLQRRIETVSAERDELNAVLASMAEAVIVIGPDDRILRFNRAAEDLFATPSASAIGRPVYEAVRNGDLLQLIEETRTLRSPQDADIAAHGGRAETLRAHAAPIADLPGTGACILLVCSDVTRLRKLETMRRDFVANVSHELKTPVTSIQGFVETLKDGAVRDAGEADRFLGIILKHTERLNALIDDLLKLSSLERDEERGGLVLDVRPLRDVLSEAASIVRPKAEAAKVGLTVHCPESLNARMNRDLLVQAAVNLADNAVKNSGPDTLVEIRGLADDAGVRIEVEDRGCGIAEEHLPRLFERFYRVDPSRSRSQGGTGLGLAIVKHIVQAHGGSVSVKSEVGKGSLFCIRIPAIVEKTKE
jgi:two-component system, OmpR family, phosphate regulon sensor histidine kinase PhoR